MPKNQEVKPLRIYHLPKEPNSSTEYLFELAVMEGEEKCRSWESKVHKHTY